MLKYIYRAIILIAVFVASIFYFSRDIKEVVFDIDNTTVMEDATFPLVTIEVGDTRINRLHGYSTNLDANTVREALTLLGTDQSFEVVFRQEEYEIKKLNYELREFNGNDLIEADSVSVFNENGNEKSAKIKLKAEMAQGVEYAVKITLITSESKKMYFYHRVKRYENTYLNENLDFVMNFHNAIKNKSTAKEIERYLEPDKKKDNTTLSKVNLYSSFDLVTWGNIQPKFLTEIIPTVIEAKPDYASVGLTYIIEAQIAGVAELFEVKEFYRVQYTKERMYLWNYERSMEALFDTELASVAKNQLKLGITSELEVPHIVSADKKKLAFTRSRELWFYDMEENEMVRIFSFRQENTDYLRDLYDQHDIRILNMDAEGNVDFLVYGYMNRGQYEGRVACILYHYIREENRIEERVYIPVDEPYQTLKENLGEFAYINALEVFYFQLYNSLYSYDLITGQLKELAKQIDRSQVVFLKEQGYVAWQDNSDPRLSKKILILELETGEVQTINSRSGYNILLMDKIDTNLIYGFVVEGDVTTLLDGREIAPMNMIEIADVDKTILKNYSKAGFYVTNLRVKKNIIELDRVHRENMDGSIFFQPAPQDYIMNQIMNETPVVDVVTRVTDQALTEAYLTMPSGFVMNKVPTVETTVHTVIAQDPTLRLPKQEQEKLYYYSYIGGQIEGIYNEAADAIKAVSQGAGVVLNNRNQLVWEAGRGTKAAKKVIPGYDNLSQTSTNQSLESSIRLLIKNLGRSVSNEQVALQGRSITETMDELIENSSVRLTGITLDQVLYYISMGRPVIAMTSSQGAVLIFGYDNFNINVFEPKQGKPVKIGLQDSKAMFEGAGNVFISYLDK